MGIMYRELIKEKGLSVTKQRIAILNALDLAKDPVTIEYLTRHVKMNTSTIYRSLKVLVDFGLVYQTDFRDGVSYFEFHGKTHHHHIVCTQCKTRKSIDACMQNKFPKIESETGYTITNHMFEIFGLCKNCSL